jgi:TPR repeat protein
MLAAVRICERILKQERRNFDAAHLLGVIRLKEGDPVRAAQLFDLAANQAPKDTAAANIFWLNHASGLAAVGRYHEAIASYDRIGKVTGQQAFALAYNRGNALAQLRRHTEAIASYHAALEIDPRQADAQFQLGRSLYLTGERQAAIASLERSIAALVLGHCALQELGHVVWSGHFRTSWSQSSRAPTPVNAYPVALLFGVPGLISAPLSPTLPPGMQEARRLAPRCTERASNGCESHHNGSSGLSPWRMWMQQQLGR